MWENVDVKGLTPEEAIAKALDLLFEYWKKTNRSVISEAGKRPERKDITEEAKQSVAKVNKLVLGELRTNPELFRDEESAAAVPCDDGTGREDDRTTDAQQLPHETTPTRPPRQNQGQQQQQQQQRSDNRGEEVASGPSSPRNLRSRATNATRDRRVNAPQRIPDLQHQLQAVVQAAVQAQHRVGQTGAGYQGIKYWGRRGAQNQSRPPRTRSNHDQQQSGAEPTQTQTDDTPRPQQNDRRLDSISVKIEQGPVSDAPVSTTSFRPNTRGPDNQARREHSAHPTTPKREGPRRNPRRGANQPGPDAANTDANANNVNPRHPRRRRAPAQQRPANRGSSEPQPPPPSQQQQHRETPHLLGKLNRDSDDLERRLGLLEANIRVQEGALQETNREFNDARRVAADMRRALSALDEVAPPLLRRSGSEKALI
ncbi:hypothetical protein PG994_003236 [Apiospora phragmitis]|uniref:Uncharacterized protein n=1 Tax=Apiospora phragmitis TaxID=2905665 RepID=A0ABR1W1B2_9PEZI